MEFFFSRFNQVSYRLRVNAVKVDEKLPEHQGQYLLAGLIDSYFHLLECQVNELLDIWIILVRQKNAAGVISHNS